MPSPFPGMDPYLEDPALWPGLHARLVAIAAEMLQPVLRERGYYVDINERVWLSQQAQAAYPDLAVVTQPSEQPRSPATRVATLDADAPVLVHGVETEIRETFLEVFDRDGRRLVTSIEFLSPANKQGKGLEAFARKQASLFQAAVNLVEIDLLRGGRHALHVPIELVEPLRPWHYLVAVTRIGASDFEIYPIPLQSRLPRIRIPLNVGDDDVVLDLQAAFERAYDTGPYPDRIDYGAAPREPLAGADVPWARQLLDGAVR